MSIHVRKKITTWGNGLGIRLTRQDAERLGVRAEDEIEAELFGATDRPSEAELDRLAIFDSGGDPHETDLDVLAEEDALGDL